MVDEVLEHLAPARGGLFVDCTVGLGGHAVRLLEAGADRLIGFDRDPAALTVAAIWIALLAVGVNPAATACPAAFVVTDSVVALAPPMNVARPPWIANRTRAPATG